MKNSKLLTEQLREARRFGACIWHRSGIIKIKDPSGKVHETPLPHHGITEKDFVAGFVSNSFRTYVRNCLAGENHALSEFRLLLGAGANWNCGDHVLTVWACCTPLPRVTISVNANGSSLEREMETNWKDLRWPQPGELFAFANGMLSDFSLIQKLKAYLAEQDQSVKVCLGKTVSGTIQVTFLHGKMVLSCWSESDFSKIRRVLDILDGFQKWCALPESPANPETMGVMIELA